MPVNLPRTSSAVPRTVDALPKTSPPAVNASRVARDPGKWVMPPEPPAPEESFLRRTVEAAGRFPDFVREPLFGAIGKINDVIFKSKPGGDPIPQAADSWTFSAIGDYGSASKAQADVATRIAASRPDLIVTLGDNVYWKGTEREWSKKWDPPQYFGDLRRNFPVRPSLGNHDIGESIEAKPYFDRFPELDGARFYSYQHKNVHFVALNSNESLAPGSPQAKWLDADLGKAKQADFKVVYMHHPLFTGQSRKRQPLQEYLGPLLAKHGVDLVLAGHDHDYERSVPFNDYGTTHVLTGGGGHTLYPFLWKQPAWSAYRDVGYGHLNIEVTNDALVGRYTLRDGKVADTFVLPKGGRAAADAARSGAANTAPAEQQPAPPAQTPAPVAAGASAQA